MGGPQGSLLYLQLLFWSVIPAGNLLLVLRLEKADSLRE